MHAVTVKPDPRITHWTDALVRRLDNTRVGLVQYLIPAGQDACFMELNPRIGAGVALPQALGLNLAVAACELASPGSKWQPDPHSSALIDRHYVWTSAPSGASSTHAGEGSSRMVRRYAALARTILSAVRAHAHATWSVRDP